MADSSAYTIIFVKHITLRNGRRIYAKTYGKEAFPIKVKSKKE